MAGAVFLLPSIRSGRVSASLIRVMVSVRCSRGPAGMDPLFCFMCGMINYPS